MRWFDDDTLWTGLKEVNFAAPRARMAAAQVEESALFAFRPGARVLDLCCGTGFYSVPLARKGLAVTGVDLSPSVLEEARRSCAAAGVDVELVRADMLDYARDESFDVVMSMFSSFGYFAEPEQNLRVLRNAYRSLVPGGQLMVDVMGKEIYARLVGPPRMVDVDGGHVYIRGSVLDNWRQYRTDWTLVRDGTATAASATSFLYSGAELMALFEAAGFTGVECFGGYRGEPYDVSARRLIVRGVRPGPAGAGRQTTPVEEFENAVV